MISLEERATEIIQQASVLDRCWATVSALLDERITKFTKELVNHNNEETRGRIKALEDLKELPAQLQSELEGIRAALSEQDAAI